MGYKLTSNFGAELNVTRYNKEKYDLHTRSYSVFLDMLGYLPLSQKFDLIGSFGVGSIYDKAYVYSYPLVNTYHKAQFSPRIGVGAQFKLIENLGIRLMLRHELESGLLNNKNSVGLGVFFQV